MNHAEMKERFEEALDFHSKTNDRGEESVKFVLGDQWDAQDKQKRHDEGRPCLTENRLMPFVDQVVNSAREIRPAIRVSPVDDDADPETAEIFAGLLRNVERQSKADIAYDTAMQYAVTAGKGWIRVNTRYADPLSFDQEMVIEAVPDWKSVVLDPCSTALDGSDAEYGFIYTDLSEKVFKDEYPDAQPVSVDVSGWLHDKKVRIVEHFYKVYEDTEIFQCLMKNGTVTTLTKDQVTELGAYVQRVIQKRETKTHKIKWAKISGAEILEETDWLGRYIPLVPVYGKTFWVDGKLESYPLIWQAMDTQRRLNYWVSANTEIIALQPKAPYVGVVGQFNTRKQQWANANRQNQPFLEYDLVIDPETNIPAPPPQRSEPILGSPAMFQEVQSAVMAISATLGMYEENRGDESNAISGIAIRSRQIRGDKSTFHFIDNLSASIRHVGVIGVDLLPKLMSEPAIRRILGKDGMEKNVPVNQPFVKDDNGVRPAETGEGMSGIYDLNAGKYDVDVDVGPSYANKQQEFVDVMREMLVAVPELASVSGDLIVKSIGGPYADELVERIRSTMPPEMIADNPLARKLEQAVEQLKQSEDQKLTLLAALEDKKKDEAFANKIKEGELHDKQANTQIKLMDTLAKIENQGANVPVQEIIQALLELHRKVEGQNAFITQFLTQGDAQATGQPA